MEVRPGLKLKKSAQSGRPNMRLVTKQTGNRREFMRDGTRYGLLSLAAWLAARLARPGAAGNQTCVNRGLCRGCAVFAGCGLPQALSVRRISGGQS